MSVLNPNVFVDRMRLLTGDTNKDEPYLEDSIYVWMYGQNGNSELDGAIQALNSIINQIVLNPEEWRMGDISERQGTLTMLKGRLEELEKSKYPTSVPVVLRSDRKNWNDFNELFGNC